MQHLFQSSFLQALGYAIANSLWQTALIWLLYIGITGLVSMSAAIKYRLAVIAQITGFIWFIITFQFYYQQYSSAWQPVAVSGNIQNIVSSNTDLSARVINWMVKGEQFLPYISMAYLILMVFLCVRWFLGYRQTQTIRYTGLQKMPVNWRLFIDKVSGQLGIKKENTDISIAECNYSPHDWLLKTDYPDTGGKHQSPDNRSTGSGFITRARPYQTL